MYPGFKDAFLYQSRGVRTSASGILSNESLTMRPQIVVDARNRCLVTKLDWCRRSFKEERVIRFQRVLLQLMLQLSCSYVAAAAAVQCRNHYVTARETVTSDAVAQSPQPLPLPLPLTRLRPPPLQVLRRWQVAHRSDINTIADGCYIFLYASLTLGWYAHNIIA